MPEKYHVSGGTKNGSCVLVGKPVCDLFNTIVVMSVVGIQGHLESKRFFTYIFHVGLRHAHTNTKTHIYVPS